MSTNLHPGLRLQWGPKEREDLREIVLDLVAAIENAPCLVAHPGEFTYECRHDSKCRVCVWRGETIKAFLESWEGSGL